MILGGINAFAGGGTAYISQTDGDWVTPATWTVNAAGECIAKDPYTISAGDSVWATCNPLETTANGAITVESGGILHVIGAGGLKGNGDITVDPGGSLQVDGNFDITGNGGLIIDGDLTIGGSVTLGGSGEFEGTGNVIITGTGCEHWTGTGTCIDSNSIVPVLFFEVAVKKINDKPVIIWSTLMEDNVHSFVIERSFDGIVFEKIGTINQHTSDFKFGLQSYQFVDENSSLNEEILYYQIKEISNRGTETTSKVISFLMESNGLKTVEIFPNPSKDVVFVDLSQKNPNEIVKINIFDAYGKEIVQKTISNGGIHSIIDERDNLSAGIYFVNLRSNSLNEMRKVILK